jgi:hypothetical protein
LVPGVLADLTPLAPLAWALSVLVGLALGLLGGGGSILLVPLLVYVLGVAPHEAVVASLVVVLVTSLTALVPHARRGALDVGAGASFGLASMVGALVGSALGGLVPAPVLLVALAAMMVLSAVFLRYRVAVSPRRAGVVAIALEGALVGLATGFVGAGGGFVVVPALVVLVGLPMEKAAPTSLLVIAMNAAAALVGHASMGTLGGSLGTVLPAALFAVAGALLGAALAPRVQPDRLRRAFVWLVGGLSVFVLGREVPALFGAPLGGPAVLVLALVALAVFGIGTALDRPVPTPPSSLDHPA